MSHKDFNHDDLQCRFNALGDIINELFEFLQIMNIDCNNPKNQQHAQQLEQIRSRRLEILDTIGDRLNMVRHGASLDFLQSSKK